MAHQYMPKLFHGPHKNPPGPPPTYLMYGPLSNTCLSFLRSLYLLVTSVMANTPFKTAPCIFIVLSVFPCSVIIIRKMVKFVTVVSLLTKFLFFVFAADFFIFAVS